MSLDLAVLRVLKHRSYHEKVSRFVINANHDKNTAIIAADFKKYWDMHPTDTLVDMDVFRSLFFNKWHQGMSTATIEVYQKLLDRVCAEVTVEQAASIVNSLIEVNLATEVANDIAAYEEGDDIDILRRIEKRCTDASELLEVQVSDDYATLDSVERQGESSVSYGWPLKCMSEHFRRVQGGDHIIIAARPDTGKTSLTMLIAVCWAMYQAKTDKKPILWFNNEGSKNRILYRMYGIMLGLTRSQIDMLKQAGTLREHIVARFGTAEPIRIYDTHKEADFQLEERIKRVAATEGVGGVVWDMLDNVKFTSEPSSSRTDEILETKYQWSRQLGVIYDYPTLATSQASMDAEGEKWPELRMLKDSKTGKQGATDVVMYMGMETDPERAAFRYISAPKNKLAKEGSPTFRAETLFNRDIGLTYESS
jgi:replicative DNA helicase